ncbi:MAG: TIM barrel protein [Eubacteriales bacterium]|nr:TIM barrel protein [Eubacteriales bacterium]
MKATRKCKFGPAGNSLSFYAEGNKSTAQAFAWLKARGLDAYEYQAGKGLYASDDTFRIIKSKAAEYGIAVSLHGPYFISLSSADDDIRMKSVRYITQSASAADMLGADIFVVHSGSAAKLEREEAMRKAEDTLEKAASAMSAEGFEAKAGIETMGKINQLGTVDEVIRLCKVCPEKFYPVVDFGHLNARTNGGIKTEDDYKRIFDMIAAGLGPERAENLHCHFSKIEYTGMGEKKHLTFADDKYGPDERLFIKAVVSLGVTPTVICESDGTMAEDAKHMKNIYEEMIK